MNAEHDGDLCGECGAIVKFRVERENERLVFLAGRLEIFAIEPNAINAYEKTRENFWGLVLGQLNKILPELEEEIAASSEDAGYARRLSESRQAVKDLITEKTQTS